VVGVTADDDVGDQLFGWQPAFDQPGRRRRLDNGALASPATISWSFGDDHTELRRDDIEPFRRVLTDDMHGATAAGTKCRRRLDDIRDAGKVFWQSPAVDMAAPAARRFQRRVILPLVSFVLGISWFDPPQSKPQLLGIDLL
jgi:hypothetical protein